MGCRRTVDAVVDPKCWSGTDLVIHAAAAGVCYLSLIVTVLSFDGLNFAVVDQQVNLIWSKYGEVEFAADRIDKTTGCSLAASYILAVLELGYSFVADILLSC